MADASSDPVAAAQMESLARALGQLTGRLQATGAQIDTSAAKAQTAAVDLEAAVRQELEAGAKLGAGGGGAGATQEATTATNSLTAAEQRAAAAAAERLAIEQREVTVITEIAAQAKAVALARQGMGGGGAGGGGRPPVIPGGPGGGFYGGAAASGGPTQEAALAEQMARARAYPALPISPVNLRTDPLTADEAATKKAAAASRDLSTAKGAAGTSAANEARIMQQSSQTLAKNNALHTDYLKALAAGTTTTRDFGSQMGQTIAKFGGWTLAAGLVYGVIGGVTELGKGALATVSSVQNLQRTVDSLDTSRASGQIRNLAQDTVTPINEAGDAVFQFSRTFHNQDDAVYAAGLALRAYKLDGVDIGLQVRAQTAIFRQFHTTMSEMGSEYGLLANGQRLFNARVTEMIPALLGSSSVIKSVGGDLTGFTKILQYMLVTTQLSGTRLATAFSRAPGFINRPKSRAALESLGLDPQQALTDFDTFFQSALEKSKRWSGEQKRLFLSSTFGTKIGPRAAGSFAAASTKLYDDIFGQNIKGAGPLMEEFGKYFDVPANKIKELGVRLQALGSNLADSGLLNVVGVFIQALDLALKSANSLLNVFNQIPGPLKTVVSILGGLKLTGMIAGRFQPTENGRGFGQAFAQFGQVFNPQKAQQNMALGALDAEQGYYRDQAENAAQRNLRLQRSLTAQQAYLDKLVAGGATDQEMAATNTRIASLKAQQEVVVAEQASITEDQLVLDRQRLEYMALMKQGYASEVAAQKAGFSVLPAGGRGGKATLGVGTGAAASADAAATAGAADATAKATAGQMQLFGANEEEIAAMEANAVAQAELAGSAGRLTIGAGIAARATAAGAAAMTAARASLSMLGGLLNPWIILLIGLPLVIGKINEGMKKLDSAVRQLNADMAAPPGPGNLQRIADDLKRKADQEDNTWVQFGVMWRHAKRSLSHMVTDALDSIGGTGPEPPPPPKIDPSKFSVDRWRMEYWDRTGSELKAEMAAAVATQQQTWVQQASQAVAGSGTKQLGPDLAKVRAAIIASPAMQAQQGWDPARYAQTIKNLDTALWQAWWTRHQALTLTQNQQTGAPLTQMQSFIAMGNQGGGFDKQIAALSQLADRGKAYGLNSDQLKQMVQLYVVIAAQNRDSQDTKVLQQVDSARQQVFTAISDQVQKLRDQANAIAIPSVKAAGAAARAAALRQKAALIQRASDLEGSETQLITQATNEYAASIALSAKKAEVKTDEAAYNAAVSNLVTIQTIISQVGNATARHILAWALNVAGLEAAVASSYQTLDAARGAVSGAQKSVAASQASGAALMAQLQKQANSLNTQGQGVANQLANQPKTPSTAGTDPFGIARLQTELTKAQNAQDPVAQARADIAFAGKELAAAKNEKERLQAQIDMTNAQNALTTALKDVRDARYKYLESLTTNPLKIDQLEVKSATADMAKVPKGTKAWYDAAAARNNALTKYRDDRVQERDDTIQFQLQMGDISQQQAESDIAAMLRIKNLSYATRKRLKRELEQLQKGTKDEFSDLNLDSIKLPTPYEVRRATMAAAQAGMNVTQTYNSTIVVNDPASAASVGVQMDRFHQGTSKAMSRARAGR